MPPHKPELKKEGSGKNEVSLSSWLKSTRRYMECVMADNTNVPVWSVMELPAGAPYSGADTLRDNVCREIILSSLSPAMGASVESLPHAADMWRCLAEVITEKHESGRGTFMTVSLRGECELSMDTHVSDLIGSVDMWSH